MHGKRTSGALIVRVIAGLAEGLGIRGTARVFEVDPNTVLQWLMEVADQLRAFSRHVLHDIRVKQVQLDELFALLSAVKGGAVSELEAIERLERSPHWVWVAMDPENKLLLAIDGGERTLAMAQRVVHYVAQVLAPDCAAALGGRDALGGIRHVGGSRAGASPTGLADQYKLCGAPQPRHPAAYRCGGTAGQHAVQR